jgi:25S rRNA (cytosine2278-C5)-methyltransferase
VGTLIFHQNLGCLLTSFPCSRFYLLKRKGFSIDKHVPNLLSFSPRIAFHEDPLYKSGKFILQDKASCFPPIVLKPPATEDARVIDATSAPGNKTSLLSGLMQNRGKVRYLPINSSKLFITAETLSSLRLNET